VALGPRGTVGAAAESRGGQACEGLPASSFLGIARRVRLLYGWSESSYTGRVLLAMQAAAERRRARLADTATPDRSVG
jgi:hypothetical protein